MRRQPAGGLVEGQLAQHGRHRCHVGHQLRSRAERQRRWQRVIARGRSSRAEQPRKHLELGDRVRRAAKAKSKTIDIPHRPSN